MSADYRPGTVAKATVRGVRDVTVFRRRDHHGVFLWETAENINGWLGHDDSDVTDIRLLVVLDPEDEAQPSPSLRGLHPRGLRSYAENLRHGRYHTAADMFSYLADQIEAQTKPPRIPEPSQFGVVEAGGDHSPGRHKWVRQGDLWWNGAAWTTWETLTDPVLVREGVDR